MLGGSHALSGLVAGAATGIALHKGAEHTAMLAGFTAGMALIPDLDSVGSCCARGMGFLSRGTAYVIRFVSGGHRHATHSFIGIAVFTLLAVLACHFRHDDWGRAGLALLIALPVAGGLEALRFMRGWMADAAGIAVAAGVVFWGYGLALIPLAVFVGCCTHIAGDMLTDSGCMLLYPLFQYRWHLLPEPARFTTGTRPERLIVDPVLMASLAGLALWVADPAFCLTCWTHIHHAI